MIEQHPEYFITIAAEQSITKAASKLYLSQPYLSRYLMNLERDIGYKLFDRSVSPIALTEAGKLYLSYLETAEHLHRKFKQDLSYTRPGEFPTLNVGMAIWRGASVLPNTLSGFLETYPNASIVLHEHPSTIMLDLIHQNVVDFCIMFDSPDLTDLQKEPILEEDILMVGHKNHPLIRGINSPLSAPRFFDISRLDGQRFLLLKKESNLGQEILNMLAQNDMTLKRVIYTTNNLTALNMAKMNLGFAFLPKSGFYHSEQNLDNLLFFRVGTPPLRCHLCVIYKKGAYISPFARAFIDEIKAYYRELSEVATLADPINPVQS